jgi:hypothetical protein
MQTGEKLVEMPAVGWIQFASLRPAVGAVKGARDVNL